MLSVYSFVVLAALFCNGYSEDSFLPPYIEPCNYGDQDLSNCIRQQIEKSLKPFTKGIKELGISSLDPIYLGELVIDGNGLTLSFTDAELYGLSNSELMDFKIHIGKVDGVLSIKFKSNFNMTAKYNADGRILILPIQGNGDAFVDAQGCEVTINCKLVQFKDEKGEHLKLTSPDFKYTIERTVFDLKNLFNGNKQLADTTLQFANENWQQLMDDLAPSAIKTIVKKVVKSINKFFASVTIPQIIHGYTGS